MTLLAPLSNSTSAGTGRPGRTARPSWFGWLCMMAFAVCEAEQLPRDAGALEGKVGLNHVYVVLDEETFAAARDSEVLLKEFASVDTGLPTFAPPQADSQRLYIRGKTTYVELLGPRNPFNEPVGKVGLALGVDALPLLDVVQAAWSASLGAAADRYNVEWKRATPARPWYEVVQHRSTSANPHLVVWASAYRSEFLPWLYPQRPAHENRGSRADFLAPLFRPERLFQDVTALTIAVPEELRQQIARQLQAVGYRRTERGEGLELQGAGLTLTLLASSAHRQGLLSMTVAMNREGAADIALGARSAIEFDTRSALWRFRKETWQ
ncbi:hypothetical protein JM946_14285 [Steroidobacter sp. S1-65]|uniref:DUF2066 domain-containing protein n=1 Tax=Steroidobacter gossypii TaxID=2805490 RepID=A0ABS1WY53_9GAMM|nr:DUF5829 family protein [Steroidobacter gossypii]MBM0105896.1 hypothetical protein [Steroidobacter gossypii]